MGLFKKSDPDPVKTANKLGAKWSPDLKAYARGEIDASKVRCALCSHAPCKCPPFGTDEYIALVKKLHGL